ncbi:hypothetical protein APASM_2629 [Actinosynnema pretiosum subsp. pretiosum]|nr:hypothetical protein APASM_2629 [Actinosynnema pretiosum subsp. pretiosum]
MGGIAGGGRARSAGRPGRVHRADLARRRCDRGAAVGVVPVTR